MAISNEDQALARTLAKSVQPLRGTLDDFDAVLDLVGRARLVMIGEATHGTSEFYQLRAQLTQRLIAERGFSAVAAEADWPDAYRVNRYVQAASGDCDAESALADFRRFPTWMWRNTEVIDFVEWLAAHNRALPDALAVGFYGLDLYSLHASMAAVLRYLDQQDPEAAQRARYRYACFDHFGEDTQAYGYAASVGLSPGCEGEVVEQLRELQRDRARRLSGTGRELEDDEFDAEQNARVVKNAEQYYRTMFQGRVSSWNLRDTHMADTLDQLLKHLGRRFDAPKIVVWAHNSHVGDARATELGSIGELNLGQLGRERYPGDVVNIGFSTHSGAVTAALEWDGPALRQTVRPALRGSWEALFHDTRWPRFLLPLRELGNLQSELEQERLQRAIGVVYRPESERLSHYFRVQLLAQFDVMIHVDETRALEPLEPPAQWSHIDAPETFPSGL